MEFKDKIRRIRPDVAEVVETKVTKDIGSNLIFQKGYTIERKEKEDKEREELVIMIRENLVLRNTGGLSI